MEVLAMELKIEQNVPIPAINKATGRTMSEETRLALKMKPGDSIFCPTGRIYMRIVSAMRNRKLAYATRKVDGGYRVWRVDGRMLAKSANA
jgi:hypothetical protein